MKPERIKKDTGKGLSMNLPDIFNYDIIFALFLVFFMLFGAHKGFFKMGKLVVVFLLPILILSTYGFLIHPYVSTAIPLDSAITLLSNTIPSMAAVSEQVRFFIVETLLYGFLAALLSVVLSFVKPKQKIALLKLKQESWKKILGAMLSLPVFYLFVFYMIFPLRWIGMDYKGSMFIQPVVENGLEWINVSPVLKHREAVEKGYLDLNDFERSLYGNDARIAYDAIEQAQRDVFAFEQRFLETIVPILRNDALAAVIDRKTFNDPEMDFRGYGMALVEDEGALIYYDLLLALEAESTSIAIVRAEYDNAKRLRGWIHFLYDDLNGIVLKEYSEEEDDVLSGVLEQFKNSYPTMVSQTTSTREVSVLNAVNDRITEFDIHSNLMLCVESGAASCGIDSSTQTQTPKAYELQAKTILTDPAKGRLALSFFAATDPSQAAGLSQTLIAKYDGQAVSFHHYLNRYDTAISANTHATSMANKMMMAMLGEIGFAEKLKTSMLVRSLFNDLGGNYASKIQIDEDLSLSDETFNVTMITVDLVFTTEIWNGQNNVGIGDMERLVDKLTFLVNNNTITRKYATELMNHFIFGQMGTKEHYFIDLIEEDRVSQQAIQYLIDADAEFISQKIKDTLSIYA